MTASLTPPSLNTVQLSLDTPHIARLTLNRPDQHNAFNLTMMQELTHAATWLARQHELRLVVLRGNGKSFCAGADLNWMKSLQSVPTHDDVNDSQILSDMFAALAALPMPLLAVAHGAAIGGGVGLLAIADYVLADLSTRFGLSETRIGLVPAVISPYVLAKIGSGHARAVFTSGIAFSAERAKTMGLVHETAAHDLDTRAEMVIAEYLKCAPLAARAAKKLAASYADPSTAPDAEQLIDLISLLRTGQEAQSGITALLAKQPAPWVIPSPAQQGE